MHSSGVAQVREREENRMKDWTEEIGYQMEELLPVAARLARRFTKGESTSVSYERAEQLMEAVLYCIQEISREDIHGLAAQRLSAAQAYQAGYAAVIEKTRRALARYHKIQETFESYGNSCLAHTFQVEIPKFFQRYDAEFAPQETGILLDYPVMADLSSYRGVDLIDAYLCSLQKEQIFLRNLFVFR